LGQNPRPAAPRLAALGSLIFAGCTLIVGGADPRDVIGGGGLDGSVHPCADVQTDPHNCGACGRDCTVLPGVQPNAVHCTAGQCDLRGACLPGRADCSGGYIDGCESDLSQANHCGNCTAICGGVTPLCTRTSGGLYTCSGSCGGGLTECGLSCVDLENDPQHCGSCSNACAASGGQTPTCVLGSCGPCASGTHNCNGVCVASNSLDSCGARCTPCPAAPANGTEICDSINGCDFVCDFGFTKSLGSCFQTSSVPDMAMSRGSDMPSPLCDCRGLVPDSTGNQCPVDNQCVANNCCLTDQLLCSGGTGCPAGTCVDKTPCTPSTTPQ
jgi:hypothetical protein